MPRASVIIPTHNRVKFVTRAIDSARQAGKNVEVIVIDDASSDDTCQVCRRVSGIRYIRLEHNVGLASARNRGIAESSADYISFLDDDDMRFPGSLDRQIKVLEQDPEAAYAIGPIWIGDSDCKPTGKCFPDPCPEGDIFWELMDRNCFFPMRL